MTRIFAAGNRERQRGVTLLELLIALALVALLASVAVGGVRASAPHLHVKLTSEPLLADLRRAREEADITGAPVRIVFTVGGYDVEALELERAVPAGVRIAIDGGVVDENDSREIAFQPGFAPRGYSIVVWKHERRAEITVDPITRRVSLR